MLRLRFAFRLPIDDVKDEYIERREQDIQRLYTNQQKIFETLESLAAVSNQMQSRVSYYEKRDPGLRELRKNWEREQERLKGAVQDAQASGILSLPGRNGNGRIIRP